MSPGVIMSSTPWVGTLVIFDDVEMLVTTYVRAALALRVEPYTTGVKVGVTVPNPRPTRLVTVRRDGGPRLDVVRESARIGVNVWAGTEQDASDLARLVRALLWAMPDGKPVTKVTELSGPSPVAEDSGARRYLTFELLVKGSELV